MTMVLAEAGRDVALFAMGPFPTVSSNDELTAVGFANSGSYSAPRE